MLRMLTPARSDLHPADRVGLMRLPYFTPTRLRLLSDMTRGGVTILCHPLLDCMTCMMMQEHDSLARVHRARIPRVMTRKLYTTHRGPEMSCTALCPGQGLSWEY